MPKKRKPSTKRPLSVRRTGKRIPRKPVRKTLLQRRGRKEPVPKAGELYPVPIEPLSSEFLASEPAAFQEEIPRVSLSQEMEKDFERNLAHPKVSVILVNHNGVDSLWHCLFSLKTQTYQAFEIILVDNASDDASVAFVKSNYPQVKILECQENFGYTMGANLGAKYATGHLVALFSNDAVATPDWLSRLVADFRLNWPGIGALASIVQTRKGEEDEAQERKTLNFLGNSVQGHFENPHVVFFPEASSMIYARFLAPDGPFDPDYFALQEDVYLGWKLRFLGREILRSRDAKIFRREEELFPLPAWKSAFLRTRNRWLNLLLFYQGGNLIKILPWMGLEALGLLLKGLVTGFNGFLGTLFALVWILFHPAAVLRKRRTLQQRRKVSDKHVLRYVSGRIVRDKGRLARFLNFFSLLYCLALGLEVMEFQQED